ncbi:MAG: serine/threonine protein kinase [Deltaproteobacteria bacterium]|nr:serine/threonine protein kinase [Deltaproteobacteria bacterium]
MDARLSQLLDAEVEKTRQRFLRTLPLVAKLLLPAVAVQLVVAPGAAIGYLVFALAGMALPLVLDDTRSLRFNLVVVALLPIVAASIVQLTRGPFVAAASFLVPILYCLAVGAMSFHLRPGLVLVTGALGALFWLADYTWLLRPNLDPALLAGAPLDWSSQITRVIFMLAFTGAVARAVSVVKVMFFQAAAAARAQDLFAKYRLERVLGEGGMGRVWAATYCPEGGFVRPVAVKLIHDHLAKQPAFVDAFRREAEVSALLLHKNIVQVLDFGREGERWFLCMELVDGVTLSALLRRARRARRQLPPAVALYLAREIVEAIGYAHVDATDVRGRPLRLVHRDLAPANVLVSRAGQVKVTDFGVALARNLRESTGSASGGGSAGGFTGVVGHLGYMSPEQARGERPDARADLYAVGVMLWEMLAGRRLFAGRGTSFLADAGAAAVVPSLRTVRPELERGPYDAIIERATAGDRTARYASARELGRALCAALDELGWPDERDLASLVRECVDVQDVHDARDAQDARDRHEPPEALETTIEEGSSDSATPDDIEDLPTALQGAGRRARGDTTVGGAVYRECG